MIGFMQISHYAYQMVKFAVKNKGANPSGRGGAALSLPLMLFTVALLSLFGCCV